MRGRININGPIGSDEDWGRGVELVDVVSQVASQPSATTFDVYLTTPGGVVEVGYAIYEYLKNLGKHSPVNMIGESIVASIGTVVFMAGVTRSVTEGCDFMIHLPMGGISSATADEMAAHAKQVRSIENKLIKFYCNVTGLTAEAIKPLLQAETWLTPEQLKTFGFITGDVPLKITALASTNGKKRSKNKMAKGDKKKAFTFKDFNKFLKKAKKANTLSMIILTADQTELDFYELLDGDEITVGAKARLAGEDPQGDIVIADGRTLTFEAGAVTAILPATEGDSEEVSLLKRALADAQAKNGTVAKQNKKLLSNAAITAKHLKKLKKLKSKFDTTGEAGKGKNNKGGKGKGKNKNRVRSAIKGMKKLEKNKR